jgi:hypothetical protein
MSQPARPGAARAPSARDRPAPAPRLTRVNRAVFAVFLVLEITEIVLFIGFLLLAAAIHRARTSSRPVAISGSLPRWPPGTRRWWWWW